MIELGVSKRSITPHSTLRLSGFADRKGPYKSVREAIFVRVHAFAAGNQRVLLIYGDLIWWGDRFINELRPKLANWFRLDASAFVFIASHNHSGPATSQDFTDALESYEAGYGRQLTQAVHDSIASALADLEEVEMTMHRGQSDLGVYRRKNIDGRMEMRPDPSVAIDKTLSILAMHRRNGSLKALAVHYACHPTISRENHLHPDYPGVLLRLLEQSLPGCHCLFLQGCAADVRPNLSRNNEFLPGDYNDVLECSEALHKDCLDALNKPGQALESIGDEPIIRRTTVRLKIRHSTAAKLLTIHCISPTRTLQWICFNAEVSQHYHRYLQSILPGCLCLGYCNGMIGYVCSREQIIEGGYEPVESAPYFGLAGPFSAAIQADIETALDQFLHHYKQDPS